MKKPIPNSICDDCLDVECVWRAPSWGIDPPVMDCPNKKAPPITNYERLIRKTPEEMAEKIGESIDCEVCKTMHHSESGECPSGQHQSCVGFWLDWLKQEAENN